MTTPPPEVLSEKKRRSPMTAATFWERTARMSSGCLVWMGTRHPSGYGMARFQKKNWKAHRLAWTLANGPIPNGLWVLHHCDNPPCVNPEHLFLGTHTDNMRDAAKKKRLPQFTGKCVRGARHGRAKLGENDVRRIRDAFASGKTLVELGEVYGVDRRAIDFIVKRITWRHVQ